MPKMIFLNLPVEDIAAATRFYEMLGCQKNEQFSDERASSMMWSDVITFQLLTRDYFKSFSHKPIADPRGAVGAMIALSLDSREDVDRLVEAAKTAGGKIDVRAAMDLGFMYNRAVEDPDGHVLELVWMDPAGMPADAS
ncbi:VOC family protein [Phyllobacterium sp. 0TCS1.6C]|uniref:VOC family protein n=1 Tax=unclassified Phyllobacterium TaxID=2638441 RepID=UPI002263C4FA|nr:MULTISPECIES: VOC family protein [unclassified Phyllobacterium]MCX8282120.1 VOC family protein [Phyllobacterium sp. 0TCS1.6C]MCX8296328.1 VOC family protein [Phyllobacterium sp. 0TCS1.6A]